MASLARAFRRSKLRLWKRRNSSSAAKIIAGTTPAGGARAGIGAATPIAAALAGVAAPAFTVGSAAVAAGADMEAMWVARAVVMDGLPVAMAVTAADMAVTAADMGAVRASIETKPK
jgi:hypothetical protein